MERAPGAYKTAGDCADGNVQDRRCFLIRNPFDTNEYYEFPMLLGQLGHGIEHPLQGQAAVNDIAAVHAAKLRHRIELDNDAAHLGGALLIDPDIMDDSEHPTVKARAGLPLIEAGKRARASLLHQIVSLFRIAG